MTSPLPGEPATITSVRHVFFAGSDISGQRPTLEGRLGTINDGMAHPAVLLLHANPAAGGSMDMKVMLALEQTLGQSSMVTLRYNSRGIGESGGQVTTSGDRKLVAPEGAPETKDIGAALDFLAMQEGVDGTRVALVGHSFGARISLAYLDTHADETRVQGVACIGLPVAWRNLHHLGDWPRPKLFVTGERDDFCPPELLADFVATLPPPATQVVLPDTGHFFEGREDELASVIAEFLKWVLKPAAA